MKPYGRVKTVKGRTFKKDFHPPKGYVNWWENMLDYVSRSTLKRDAMDEAQQDIIDNEND
jgi:hypothetical protein